MTWTLRANGANAATNSNGPAQVTLDTTGVDFIVTSGQTLSNLATLSDNLGNSFQQDALGDDGGVNQGGNHERAEIRSCVNPTVSSTHVFTYTGGSTFPSLCIQAWSGALLSGTPPLPRDQASTNGGAAPITSPGSITTTQGNELIIVGGWGSAGSTISGFTISDQGNGIGGSGAQFTMGYLAPGSGAYNPTITAWQGAAAIASYEGAVPPVTGFFPSQGGPRQFLGRW